MFQWLPTVAFADNLIKIHLLHLYCHDYKHKVQKCFLKKEKKFSFSQEKIQFTKTPETTTL